MYNDWERDFQSVATAKIRLVFHLFCIVSCDCHTFLFLFLIARFVKCSFKNCHIVRTQCGVWCTIWCIVTSWTILLPVRILLSTNINIETIYFRLRIRIAHCVWFNFPLFLCFVFCFLFSVIFVTLYLHIENCVGAHLAQQTRKKSTYDKIFAYVTQTLCNEVHSIYR